MSEYVEVTTQAELDAALKRPGVIPVCRGAGYFQAWGSATVEARDSATVEAWGSATVEAWDSATVRAGGSATVRAGKFCAVTKQPNHTGTISGGVVIEIPPITTVEEWCDFYGVEPVDGALRLYKAVGPEFESGWTDSIRYEPGTTVEAPDWDGGKAECGGGLHFSPRPWYAQPFSSHDSPRYVECEVAAADVVVHHPAMYPNKVKARRCVVVREVDVDGVVVAGEPTGDEG